MLNFRPITEPFIKLCGDMAEEIKQLKYENAELKEMLESTRHDLFYTREQNRFLSESLADLQNEKRKDLEKRVADLEEQLAKKVFLLDDNCTPIKSFTLTGKLVLMEESKENTEEKLKVGKWYHTTDFTKEKLERLLPVGTKVIVEHQIYYLGISEKPPKETERCTVEEVVKGQPNQKTYIKVKERPIYKEWFKIIEE